MKKVFILSLIILVLVSNVNAQLESKQCYDKCINNIFYSHGIFDVKKNKCIYKQEVCKYGCENKVKCRDYPTKLPKNDTDAREVIFDINKKIFDHVKTKIEIRGTEYYGGEYGKIFLHLSDGGHELNNGTCFITVYYPNTTKFIDNVGMTCLGENGLYYINFFVPENVFGVYMICAYCYIPRLAYNLTCITSSYDGFESGNWSGGYGWSDVWYQEGDSSIVTTGTTHNGTYHLRLRRGNAWVERSVNNLYDVVNTTVSLWAKVNSFESGEYSYMYFWDGNWNLIKTWSNDDDDNTYHYYEFNLSGYHLGNNIIAFESDMSGTGDYFYVDDLTIKTCVKNYYFMNDTVYQQVRGSGELHVSELPEKIYDYFVSLPEPTKISNHDYCIDNQTMGKSITYKLCINNNCKMYVKNETIPCTYGCAGNRCLPEPFWIYVIIAIIILVIMVFIYLMFR